MLVVTDVNEVVDVDADVDVDVKEVVVVVDVDVDVDVDAVGFKLQPVVLQQQKRWPEKVASQVELASAVMV